MSQTRKPVRWRTKSSLVAIYNLIHKYPGVSFNNICEMTKNDRRLQDVAAIEGNMKILFDEFREKTEKDSTPKEVKRALEIHDRLARAGLGDAFRYLVRSVERGQYFGLLEIQQELGILSNSFQKKFNKRLPIICEKYEEVNQVYQAWLELRHSNNPIVRMHRDEW